MSLSPPHPLYGAHVRAKRAGYLIGTLRKQLQRWTTDQMSEDNMRYRELEPMVFEAFQENPPIHHLFRAAVTIGEIAYNCRAALDYLVAELARGANRGREVRRTQFPMEDRPDMFEARVTGVHPDNPTRRVDRYLHKVPPPAVAMFRNLQPFAGCEWTTLLRDVSNPDKHRFVPRISSNESFENTVYDPTTKTLHGRLVVNVVFEHNREIDVVSGMSLIQRQTAHLITGFAPAFISRGKPSKDIIV